jgi:hypothetical protein
LTHLVLLTFHAKVSLLSEVILSRSRHPSTLFPVRWSSVSSSYIS